MTVYITKYALTRGILETELIRHYNGSVTVRWPDGLNDEMRFYGKDWYFDLTEAKYYVELMRQRRIISLKEQIDKLKTLEFKVTKVD